MDQIELKKILELHEMWLLGNEKGKQADLDGVDIRGQNLAGVNLRGAYLGRTDLRDANLSGADLGSIILIEADLKRANLRGANLRRAHLNRANLHEADLREIDFHEVDLREASLSGAKGFYQFGPTKYSSRMVYCNWWPSLNTWKCKDEAFYGTVEELEERVRASHNCPSYLSNIELLKNWKYE